MAKLNLLLVIIAVACALATVSTSHQARKLFMQHESEQKRMHDLEVEWSQLQLEQSTWANHARIEKIAREKLGMHPPAPGRIISVAAEGAR